MSKSRSADQRYKDQAKRLAVFLKAGGHEIKHSHALEAVAAMHGAKDFHTLQHEAIKQDHSAPALTYVVNTFGKGQFVESAVTTDLQAAVSMFLQTVQMYSDVLSDDDFVVAGVTGGARTEGLYCYADGLLIATLLQAGVVGTGDSFQAPAPEAKELSDLTDLAYFVSATLRRRKQGNWQERRKRLEYSVAVRNLAMDPAEDIFQQAESTYLQAEVDDATFNETRTLLDSCDVYVSMKVTVKEGGIISM